MTYRCPNCGCALRGVIARPSWTEHMVCVPCGRVFTCWSGHVYDCETPTLCAPFPWQLWDPPESVICYVQPGPQSRGLL